MPKKNYTELTCTQKKRNLKCTSSVPVVTLAQFRVNYSSPPLSSGGPLLVVAWFAHAQSRRIFFHRGKISISQFLTQAKPGSISALFVNKIYYFRIKVSRVITKVHRGILRGSPVIIIVYGLHHRIMKLRELDDSYSKTCNHSTY